MKTKIRYLLIFALITFSVSLTKQSSAQQGYVSIQVFYDQLSPYGQWVDYPDYGYVWIPEGGSDFVPYSTAGHWVLSNYGWTWVSDFEWGWAPFHYGRWRYDNFYGWFWIPDTEWGPAWVIWRSADGYYGWAPMDPGISITVGFHREYNERNDHWMFVRSRDIDRPHINLYYVNRTDHDRLIRNSTVIRNTYDDRNRNTTYITGPAREDVQKATGRKFRPVVIQENPRPGQNLRGNQLQIYRPRVNNNNDKDKRIAPSRVSNLKDIKQPSERKTTNQRTKVNNSRNRREQNTNVANPTKDNRNEQSSRTRNDREGKNKDKKR